MSEIVTRNVMRYVTVTALLSVWGAANEHTRDGVFQNADLSDIDDMAGVPGFGAAMAAVGWAEYDEEQCTVSLPNFNEYNTSGSVRSAVAKTAAVRQKEYRDRKTEQKSDVTRDVTRDVTNDVTRDRREEKRREDINTPIPPSGAKTENSAISLPTWLTTIKAKGEDPIPADDPVFGYADSVGIPRDHLRLAWREFRERYSLPGAKRYKNWRTVFGKAVRGNWFKLWHFAGDECALTTTGVQAKRAAEANAGAMA